MRPPFPDIVCCLLIGCAAAHADTQVLKRDPELSKLIPQEALQGPGAWEIGGRLVATGQCIEIDSLGKAKGRRTETEFAEDDAKLRLARLAATTKDASFNPEMFDLQMEMRGVRVAATYHLDRLQTLFLVAVAEKKDVEVKLSFSPVRARRHAQLLFVSGDWKEAAKIFSVLNSHGIEDAETIAWARAASAHVNLDAGVVGDSKVGALKTLAAFHEERKQWDSSLKFYHLLYTETDSPNRALLEKLVKLAKLTQRPNNAESFQKEIQRRWPQDSKP